MIGRSALARLVGVTWRASPSRCAALAVLALVEALAPVALAVVLGRAARAAAAGDTGDLDALATVFAVAIVGEAAAGLLAFRIRAQVQERASFALERHLMGLVGRPRTAEHLERAEVVDEIDLVDSQRLRVVEVVPAAVNLVALAARLVVTVVLLARVSPFLVAAPVLGIPSFVAARRAQRILQEAHETGVQDRRLSSQLLGLALSPATSKEIRTYGVQDALLVRQRSVWTILVDRLVAATRGADLLAVASGASVAVLYVGSLGVVVAETGSDAAGLGDIVQSFTLLLGFSTQVAGLAGVVSWFARTVEAGRHLDALEAAVGDGPASGAPVPPSVDIELRDVAYSYPGSARPAIEVDELRLRRGEVVLVVGENGAGKTTLARLLLGLYEPQRGQVLISGRDLQEIDAGAWGRSTSAVLQDYTRPELTLLDAVDPGLADADDRERRVCTALRAASADDVLEQVGLHGQLGPSFSDGSDLSGGQWQKIALARGAMRRDPALRVLDEPSASLDPFAERAVLEHYLAQAAASPMTITVLVSHRFTTIAGIPRILVVEEGRIIEDGSHDDLIALGGRYALLHRLQVDALRGESRRA